MRSNMWKRMIALACAGIMVVGGSSWSTVSVKAAEEAPSLEALSVEEAPALEAFGVEENDVTESYAVEASVLTTIEEQKAVTYQLQQTPDGYVKIRGLKIRVDSEERTAEANGTQGHGYMAADEHIETFWHSNWSGTDSPNANVSDPGQNNTATIVLPTAWTVKGVTYSPRKNATTPNGTVNKFKVKVKIKGSEQFVEIPTDLTPNFGVDGTYPGETPTDYQVIFKNEIKDVEEVQFVFTDAKAGFITASELGVLTNKGQSLKQMELWKKVVDIKDKYGNPDEKEYNDENKYVYEQAYRDAINQAKPCLVEGYTDENAIQEALNAVNALPELLHFERERGKGHWLSDLAIESAVCGWTEDGSDQPRVDSSWKNNPLQMLNQKYKKGFGTHVGTSVDANYMIFDLGAGNNYKVFEAVGGMQQGRWGQGTKNVEFKVYIQKEGETEYTCVWSNKDDLLYKESGTEEERVINICADIRGARKLKLEAEGTGNGGGHVNWADAKLYTELNRDSAALQGLVEYATKKFEDPHYPSERRDEIKAKVAEVEAVIDDVTKDQQDIDNAYKTLKEALATLEESRQYIIKSNVDGTILEQPCKYNDPVTVEIGDKKNVNGKQFSGWTTKDGILVSKEETYKFYVMGDMELTAVYSDPVKQEAKAILRNIVMTPNANNNGRYDVQFIGQAIIPKEDKSNFKAIGLLWGPNENVSHTYTAPRCNDKYQFSVTLRNIPSGKMVYGKVFVRLGEQVLQSELDSIMTTPDVLN